MCRFPKSFIIAILFVVMNVGVGLHSVDSTALAQSESVTRSELGAMKDDVERIKARLVGVQKELELMRQRPLQDKSRMKGHGCEDS